MAKPAREATAEKDAAVVAAILSRDATSWPSLARALRIGCDPGTEGGLVAVWHGYHGLAATPMPMISTGTGASGDRREIHVEALLCWLRAVASCSDDVAAVIERAQAFPEEGAVSSFHYGMGYGMLRAAFAAVGIRHSLVTSRVWQRACIAPDLLRDNLPKAAVRQHVVTVLREVNTVPTGGRVPHVGMADAAVMAQYGFTLFRPLRALPPGPTP